MSWLWPFGSEDPPPKKRKKKRTSAAIEADRAKKQKAADLRMQKEYDKRQERVRYLEELISKKPSYRNSHAAYKKSKAYTGSLSSLINTNAMSIAKISKKAQQIRKHSPGMSWHSAQKKAAAMLRTGGAPKRKTKRHTATTAVARTTHRKKHSKGIGSTTITVKRKKSKKKGIMGASLVTTNRLYQIVEMGAGMAVGAAGTHAILRPIEHKIVSMVSDPKIQGYVAKAMPWAEMVAGGLMFIVSGNKHIRNIGVGVMGSGVHGAVKALPFHLHSPAETINGVGDFVQTRIPINGTMRDTICGLIQNEHGYTKTPVVGDSILRNGNGAVHTPVVGGQYSTLYNTPKVGDYGPEDEEIFYSNAFKR